MLSKIIADTSETEALIEHVGKLRGYAQTYWITNNAAATIRQKQSDAAGFLVMNPHGRWQANDREIMALVAR